MNNAGGGGGITGRHHHQGGPTGTGMGMGNGQNYPNNQHDFASGGGTYNDPGFNNTASTGGQYGGGQFGGPGQQGGGGGVGGEQFGGPGHMHQGTGGGQFGGPGQGAGGQYGGGGPGGVTGGGLGAPTGGGGGGGVTGTSDRAYQHTGVGNDGNNMGSQAPVGASAGEKEFVGKVERLAGTALCSSSLKAKGAEKERSVLDPHSHFCQSVLTESNLLFFILVKRRH